MLLEGCVKHVFIHLIQPIEYTWGYTGNFEKWQKEGIFFFTTYVGAALEAYNRKLIHLKGLYRITFEAFEEFKKILFSCKFSSHNVEETYFIQLVQDIKRVNLVLPEEMKIQTQDYEN